MVMLLGLLEALLASAKIDDAHPDNMAASPVQTSFFILLMSCNGEHSTRKNY